MTKNNPDDGKRERKGDGYVKKLAHASSLVKMITYIFYHKGEACG